MMSLFKTSEPERDGYNISFNSKYTCLHQFKFILSDKVTIWGIWCAKMISASLRNLDQVSLYLRVHSHSGKFDVDVSAGCCCSVTGEGLGRWHLVPPTELQRTAAIHLFDLWQVRLRCYHHTWSLAVHEVLLRREWEGDEWSWCRCFSKSWSG